MTKQKKPHEVERTSESPAAETDRTIDVDPALSEQATLGNQAMQATLGEAGLGRASSAGSARTRVEGAGLALRVAPRDPAWTARMVDLVQRSALPDDRKRAVAERLTADQDTADRVQRAVVEAVGHDDEAMRAQLVSGLDRLSQALAGPGGAELLVQQVAAEVLGAAWLGRDTAHAVDHLVSSLSVLQVFGFDEEEEEGAAGDYALEESGS